MKPSFEEGGKFHAFRSVFDGFETFLFVPNTTAKRGSHIHDCNDSKRAMSMVVIALMPALLFGIYNVGFQHYLVNGEQASFLACFVFGLAAVLPKIVVSYLVGLGNEDLKSQICRLDMNDIILYIKIIEAEKQKLEYNVNFKLWLDSFFSRIIGEVYGRNSCGNR